MKNQTLYEDLKELRQDLSKVKPNGNNFKEALKQLDELLKTHNPNRKVAALLRPKD